MHVVHNYQTCNNNGNWTQSFGLSYTHTGTKAPSERPIGNSMRKKRVTGARAFRWFLHWRARDVCIQLTLPLSLSVALTHARTHTSTLTNSHVLASAPPHTYNIIDTPVGSQRERTYTHAHAICLGFETNVVVVRSSCASHMRTRVGGVSRHFYVCPWLGRRKRGAPNVCVCVCACGGRAHARIEKVESQSSVRERVAPHAIGPLSLICVCVSSARRNRRANTKWLWMRAACWFGGEFNMCVWGCMHVCVCMYSGVHAHIQFGAWFILGWKQNIWFVEKSVQSSW